MREIKFKAWDINEEELFEVFSFDMNHVTPYEPNRPFAITIQPDREDVVLLQYTGLKDINGREIYEGDILKRTINLIMHGTDLDKHIDEYLEVKYREDYAGFYIGERPLFAYIDTITDVDTGCKCSKAEVVGNVYENPRLLEEE